MYKKEKFGCCDNFKHAQENGTDNESYGSAVWKLGGEWQIGTGLPALQFCPWCGESVAEVKQ